VWSSSFGRALVLATGAAALLAAAPQATAAGPRVEAMVVHRSGATFGPRAVLADAAPAGHCRAAPATPLAVLAALDHAGGPSFRVRGACSALYVFQVGGDRASGRAGWVYKVGHRLGTTAAGDPTGPFGTGRRLSTGQRVAWFWCASAARCQRTLAISGVPARVRRRQAVRVVVRAYDDNGRGVRAAGVRVSLGAARAVTGRDGTARLTAPARRGRVAVGAARRGLVPAFPTAVTVT
jgi:hypothetical protein